MKTITLTISNKKFKQFISYIGDYEVPKCRIKQNDICRYVALELAQCGLDGYDNLGSSDFYNWFADKIARKFRLKRYEE